MLRSQARRRLQCAVIRNISSDTEVVFTNLFKATNSIVEQAENVV